MMSVVFLSHDLICDVTGSPVFFLNINFGIILLSNNYIVLFKLILSIYIYSILQTISYILIICYTHVYIYIFLTLIVIS